MRFLPIYTADCFHNVHLYIVDMVNAYHDAWIIGDDFLRDITNTFFKTKNTAMVNKRRPPYLFKMYNVAAYFNSSTSPMSGLA